MKKICSRCGQFNNHRKRSARKGFICYCWECEKEKSRQYNYKLKKYIVELLGQKCSSCGIKDHPCIYDTHHIDQDSKIYNCSTMRNKAEIAKELSKCELLCVRCHRLIKHNNNRKFDSKKYQFRQCKSCMQVKPHRIEPYKSHISSSDKRAKSNDLLKLKMINKWKVGYKIVQIHKSQIWTKIEWKEYCQENFGFGSRNASDYETLARNYTINTVPSSLNEMKHRQKNKALLNENKTSFLRNICIECTNSQNRERKQKIKKQCIDYKGNSCHSCGLIVEPECFDFHHLNQNFKEFNISRYSSFANEVLIELDKCVLLCCHCHRKVHSNVLSLIIQGD